MRLAINENYRNKAGENVERTCFVDLETWGRQAETCGEYLAKGSEVLVEGSLSFDQWENQQGEKRSKLRVRAFRVQFLGSPARKGGGQEQRDNTAGVNTPSAQPASAAGNDNDDNSGQTNSEDLPF
jgi:single-strand DNA-binding protein